jgi:hypothetical protein
MTYDNDSLEEIELITGEDYDRFSGGRDGLTREALALKYGFTTMDEAIESKRDSARDIARRDFEDLVKRVKLDATEKISPLLLVRTVQGHANSGHCEFKGKIFPNFTIDASVAANMNTLNSLLNGHGRRITHHGMKIRCQEVIDDIGEAMHNIIDGKKLPYLVNSKGEPLAGANIFLEDRIDDENQDPLDVVRGFYLGSCMDNYEWRKKVQERDKFIMGGGICCPVNVRKLEERGFDLGYLSENEFEKPEFSDILDNFLRENIVVLDRNVESKKGFVNGYVRMKKGQGISDDCAIINAGFLYNKNVARGVFLADAVDTWGTFVPVLYARGHDEIMGEEIKKRADREDFDLRLSEENIIDFISLSAINPDPRFSEKYPDSSQRYFLQKGTKGLSAVRSHFSFIEQLKKEIDSNVRYRKPETPKISLGFQRVSSREFYCEIRTRIIHYLKENGFLGQMRYKEC